MVVTSASIPLVSEYVVSDSGTFTTSLFNALLIDAQAILEHDNPGLSDVLYDRALALMVCHLFDMRSSDMGVTSFRAGDYSETSTPGGSSFLLQYNDIITRGSYSALTTLSQEECRRCDVDVGDMALDMTSPQEFWL